MVGKCCQRIRIQLCSIEMQPLNGLLHLTLRIANPGLHQHFCQNAITKSRIPARFECSCRFWLLYHLFLLSARRSLLIPVKKDRRKKRI